MCGSNVSGGAPYYLTQAAARASPEASALATAVCMNVTVPLYEANAEASGGRGGVAQHVRGSLPWSALQTADLHSLRAHGCNSCKSSRDTPPPPPPLPLPPPPMLSGRAQSEGMLAMASTATPSVVSRLFSVQPGRKVRCCWPPLPGGDGQAAGKPGEGGGGGGRAARQHACCFQPELVDRGV